VLIYLICGRTTSWPRPRALWIGIPVDNNFDWLPRATSVREFWRRWHITLGSWLRDTIYIPLGGNRGVVLLNYAAVFGFCAVWHGPSISFWSGARRRRLPSIPAPVGSVARSAGLERLAGRRRVDRLVLVGDNVISDDHDPRVRGLRAFGAAYFPRAASEGVRITGRKPALCGVAAPG